MKKIAIFLCAAIIGLTAIFGLSGFASSGSFFELSKNLDIFTTLYKELNTYYVDDIDPDKLVQTGIEEMCSSLDPYTDFISEENMADYRTQTTGRYGGIGAIIGTRGDWVTITDPYDGFPAAKAGLRAGDKIVSIDGKSAKKFASDDVSRMLKGKPGTTIALKISRQQADGSEKEMDVTLTREEIKIKNVPYFGTVNKDIGYIRLTGFTEKAGSEVHNALNMLIAKDHIKGLILDLRGNPGGLLNEAINTSNVFVDKNTLVVFTKGKTDDQNKEYPSLNEPVDTKIPVTVLVDGGSASAAEIVTGSLQDLDRAVVVGQRTYGKGIVQSTHSMPYNAKLKITTAKYYIPSGRCIQAINYADRAEDGSVKRKADSLKVAFKTKGGRTVYDGVGIDPDIKTEPEKVSQITIALVTHNLIFDYATEYRAKHEAIGSAKNFELSDAEYDEFVAYCTKQDFNYTNRSEKLIEELKQTAEKENHFNAIAADYDVMKKAMKQDKKKDLYKEKKQIKGILEEEIASRYTLNAGRVEAGFKNDPEIAKAVEVLNDPDKMKSILTKN
ncbi:MAG: S41 family peptidase [Bacteroidetes bacterium]|nr:S41 family peptidase [Bacteroidota bacterium]